MVYALKTNPVIYPGIPGTTNVGSGYDQRRPGIYPGMTNVDRAGTREPQSVNFEVPY